MKRSRPDPRAQSKRAALNALRRARNAVSRGGIDLSEWEGQFLGSIETRLMTFGRAFRDPEKGRAGEALSVRQGAKLKEIRAKAGGAPPRRAARPSGRARPGAHGS